MATAPPVSTPDGTIRTPSPFSHAMNEKPSDFAGQTPIPIEQLKRLELDILEAFVLFCRKHSLPFFLTGGTLLGAVRHKGFIPWDDDIDVVMLRPDYDRFVSLFSKADTAPLAIVSGDTSPSFPLCSLKIHDTRTVLFEAGVKRSFCGVCIDVFPLDPVPGDDAIRLPLLRRLAMFRTIRLEKVRFCQTHPSRLKALSIAIRYALLHLLPMSVPRALHNAAIRRAARRADGRWVGNLTSPLNLRAEFFPRSWFDSTVPLPFEHLVLPAFSHYEDYLSAIYGDYMTPPPPEQRILRHGSLAFFKSLGSPDETTKSP